MNSGRCKYACIIIFSIAFIASCVFPKLEAQSKSTQDSDQIKKLMQLGADAMHQGQPADAERYFSQATLAAPGLADAYLGLGLAQMRENKTADAEESLRRAIELNPKLLGAH